MLKELSDIVEKDAATFAESKRFKEITEQQRETLSEAAKSIRDSITTDFTNMINNAVPDNAVEDQRKFQLRLEISTLLVKLEETLQKELKNPEAELHTAANYFVREGLIPEDGSADDVGDDESVVSNTDKEASEVLSFESEDDSDDSGGSDESDESDESNESDDKPDSQENLDEAYQERELCGVTQEPIGASESDEVDAMDIDSLIENQAQIAEQAKAKDTEMSEQPLFVSPYRKPESEPEQL
ncbi:hypothetical protein HYALB_00005612 [Hymenoscyphus albidus]|uniref:Uncharacterized protein n=1 Tax=Hymenoscyphus albidus TaxID=595503 RepID=A0A9N9LI01_9HELO|nr:hypothetical protein HYALB_00005612 [Hymenoscyphus albidus]